MWTTFVPFAGFGLRIPGSPYGLRGLFWKPLVAHLPHPVRKGKFPWVISPRKCDIWVSSRAMSCAPVSMASHGNKGKSLALFEIAVVGSQWFVVKLKNIEVLVNFSYRDVWIVAWNLAWPKACLLLQQRQQHGQVTSDTGRAPDVSDEGLNFAAERRPRLTVHTVFFFSKLPHLQTRLSRKCHSSFSSNWTKKQHTLAEKERERDWEKEREIERERDWEIEREWVSERERLER